MKENEKKKSWKEMREQNTKYKNTIIIYAIQIGRVIRKRVDIFR